MRSSRRRTIGIVTTLAVGLVAGWPASATAGDEMPVAQQNALLQKHCTVCHNDTHVNGGLSLEHFDAAQPDPTVAAMVLSKVRDGGAMSAASIPMPDGATQDALVNALAAKAVGATNWTVNRRHDPETDSQMVTVSIVRELHSATRPAPDLYRLTTTCHVGTREAEMQVAWSPAAAPKNSVVSAVVDGQAPVGYEVEGSEKHFRGSVGTMGTGAVVLSAGTSLPKHTLTINDIFQAGTVVFPFSDLPETARQALSPCFTGFTGFTGRAIKN